MSLSRKSWVLTGLLLGLVFPLAACSNSSFSEGLERSLAADPRLQATPGATGLPAEAPTTVNLPADFPNEIPLYPGATLQAVLPNATQALTAATVGGAAPSASTRWQTPDTPAQVRQWYEQRLQAEGWQLQPTTEVSPAAPLVAQRNDLRIALTIQPIETSAATNPPGSSPVASPQAGFPFSIPGTTPQAPPTPAAPTNVTVFSLDYLRVSGNSIVGGVGTGAATPSPPVGSAPQPGDPAFIGPVPPADFAAQSPTTPTPAAQSTPPPIAASPNIAQAPTQLQSYIADLTQLGALKSSSGSSDFQPNETIARREFARWLVNSNNALNANRPANQIRLAVPSSQPVFQDVPANDPDFGAIQGLAEAGVIPSPLSGDTGAVTFRPDAPLTRETLLLWKVPLDIRRSLPNGSVELVQQTWGFQDAPQINPKVLRALVADHQNGEQSNIRRAFGFTTLFQPNRPVTRAEAAAALWFFGSQGDGISAKDALTATQPAPQP